ncbi:MAG: hypothetical protein NW237_00445 [Cyanobacteriota bacterium]|nr:hypothetical protein [Cyanobacteriota bacterium]
MRWINSSSLVGFLGSFVLVGLIAWGLSWQVEEIQVDPPPPAQPPVVSRSVDLIGRRGGQQRWRLLAEEVELEQGQQIFDRGAHGFFYGNPSTPQDEGELFFRDQEEMAWEAKQARYNPADDQLFLTEEVAVNGQDGSQLLTSALKVTPEEAIEVPAAFTLKGDEVTLSGESGTFNFQFARLTAKQGRLTVHEPDPLAADGNTSASSTLVASATTTTTTITADDLQYDRHNQIAEGQGNLVIQDGGIEIKAPQGRYNRKAAQSILSGGVTLREVNRSQANGDPLLADLTLVQAEPADSPEQEVTIIADQLTYDRNTQIAQGEGNLEIQQGETVIAAPTGSYRRKESQSVLTGGVTLREPQRVLQAARLEGNHRDKIFLFEENVVYTQLAEGSPTSGEETLTEELRRAETEVKSTRLVYNSRSETSEFSDNVEFIQKNRQATAQQARITPEQVLLEGDVTIQQIRGDWLARRLDNPETQADVDRPTLIFADRVEIDQATSDARFYDNVVIVQSNRAAEGDSAIYSDRLQTFELLAESAPVLLCDRGTTAELLPDSIESLPGRDALDVTCRGANKTQAQRINLDMANDTFTAIGSEKGQSSIQFKVTNEAP